MPPKNNTPGVYVDETASGVHTIAGVDTSLAVFLGRAKRGPLNKPVLCQTYAKFQRTFSSVYAHSDLARSVKLFFENGGNQCYVLRLAPGAAGGAPAPVDYQRAFAVIARKVDLFNLLVLPEDADQTAAITESLWAPASLFCQQQRAFLLMDPPRAWNTVQAAIDPATGVYASRAGLVKDHCAIFYPRVLVSEQNQTVTLGPSGALAGLLARTDSARGVWKAPAGVEADLRGITGLENNVTNTENGALNARGINTLRTFPTGIVNWGARTLDGDDALGSEYKYLPVRRLALFVTASLDRGLPWTVFEPNDEPLWAKIRLNVSSFLFRLFQQGAFQGRTPQEAYFVKCDAATSTAHDRSLGQVNLQVGIAPLKPAEFLVLRLQLTAGKN